MCWRLFRALQPVGLLLLGVLSVLGAATGASASDYRIDRPHDVRDPAYGQILYEYYQQRYFAALTSTLIALDTGALPEQRDRARVLLGALYANYGMPDEAEALFRELLDEAVDPELAIRVWVHLAELYYRQGRYPRALSLLEIQQAVVPPDLRQHFFGLRARILMRLGRFDEAASELDGLATDDRVGAYVRYNLAVSHINAGEGEQGVLHLRRLAALQEGDDEINAIKDKAILALGVHHLRRGDNQAAAEITRLARLDGPFSDVSLLLHARAMLHGGTPERALGSLQQLTARSMQRETVQEASLLLPYFYDLLGDVPAARDAYRDAIRRFTEQMQNLGELANHIRSGDWFTEVAGSPQWSTAMDALPDFLPAEVDSFATFERLFASHAFQKGWQNYHEILRQQNLLERWAQALPAMETLLAAHQRKHDETLPAAFVLLQENQDEDFASRLDALFAELDRIQDDNDWRALATSDERRLLEALDDASARAEKLGDRLRPELHEKLAFYRGLLAWDLQDDLVPRQWQQRRALRESRTLLQQNQALAERVHEAAGRDLARMGEYRQELDELSATIDRLETRGDALLRRQQQAMERLALAHIDDTLKRLVFFTAESWDALGDLQSRAVQEGRVQRRGVEDQSDDSRSSE